MLEEGASNTTMSSQSVRLPSSINPSADAQVDGDTLLAQTLKRPRVSERKENINGAATIVLPRVHSSTSSLKLSSSVTSSSPSSSSSSSLSSSPQHRRKLQTQSLFNRVNINHEDDDNNEDSNHNLNDGRKGDVPWKPYSAMKLKQSNKLKNKLKQSSAIAQVLSEVRSLPELRRWDEPEVAQLQQRRPTSPNGSSERVKRLLDKRLKAHDNEVFKFHDFRVKLERKLQLSVEKLGIDLQLSLKESKELVKEIFESLADEHIVKMTEWQIDNKLNEIEQEFKQRARRLRELDQSFKSVENTRVESIQNEVARIISILSANAHTLPHEIERMFQQDIHECNVHVARNHGSYSELISRLSIADVKALDSHRKEWQLRKTCWRKLRHKFAIDEWKEMMTTDQYVKPVARREVIDQLRQYQNEFVQMIGEQANILLGLVPPNITVSEVEDIANRLVQIHVDCDVKMDRCVQQLWKIEEDLHQDVNHTLLVLKDDLIAIAAYSVSEIDDAILAVCSPIEFARHEYVKDMIGDIQKALDRDESTLVKQMDHLSNFYKRVALFWETYIISIRELNHNWEEKLAIRADEYSDELEELEAKLKQSLYLMAREPFKDRLDARLEEVSEIVGPSGLIEVAHRNYNSDSVQMAISHPAKLQQMIIQHVKATADLWGLRTPEDDALIRAQEKAEAKARAEALALAEEEENKKGGKRRNKKSARPSSRAKDDLRKGRGRSRRGRRHEEEEDEDEDEQEEIDQRKRLILDEGTSHEQTFIEVQDTDEFATAMLDGNAMMTTAEKKEARKKQLIAEEKKKKEEEEAAELKRQQEEEEAKKARRKKGKKSPRSGSSKRSQKKNAKNNRKNAKNSSNNADAEAEDQKKKEELSPEELEALAKAEEEKKIAEANAKEIHLQHILANIPNDTDGLPIFSRIEVDMDAIRSSIPVSRMCFLQEMHDWGLKDLTRQQELSHQRQYVLGRTLDYELRRFRPRLARLEVDVYDPRVEEQISNSKRFDRYESRVEQVQAQLMAKIEDTHCLALAKSEDFKNQIAKLSSDVAGCTSLAVLNRIHKEAGQLQSQLRLDLEQNRTIAGKLVHELQQVGQTMDEDFVASCKLIPDNAEELKKNRKDILHAEDDQEQETNSGENEAEGSVSANNNNNNNNNNNMDLGTYHAEEIEYYRGMVQELAVIRHTAVASSRKKIEELEKASIELLNLDSFTQRYHQAHEELAVTLGLGHRYGAPKRELTSSLRQEYNRSREQADEIQQLIQELKQVCGEEYSPTNGYSVPERLAYEADFQARLLECRTQIEHHLDKSIKKKKAQEAEEAALFDAKMAKKSSKSKKKERSTQSRHHDGKHDDTNVENIANVEAVPSIYKDIQIDLTGDEKVLMIDELLSDQPLSWKSVRIIKIIEKLVKKLYARAKYLECFRKKAPVVVVLSNIPIVPVIGISKPLEILPVDEVEAENFSKNSKNKIKNKNNRAPSSRGTRHLESKQNEMDDDDDTTMLSDEQKRLRMNFMQIVHAADTKCHIEMNKLWSAYDLANPDRVSIFNPPKSDQDYDDNDDRKDRKSKKTNSKKKKSDSKKSNKKNSSKAASSSSANSKDTIVIPPAIEAHCKHEVLRAKQKRQEYIRQFRVQVDEAFNYLPHVPKEVFLDIQCRMRDLVELVVKCLKLDYDEDQTEFSSQAALHTSKLRPSIASRPSSVLEELCQNEAQRSNAEAASTERLRRSILVIEGAASHVLIQRILHASHSLMSLFDSCLAPSDLPLPAEGEIELIRKSLKRLVREANRQKLEQAKKELEALEKSGGKKSKKGSADTDGKHSRFPLATWEGVPLNVFALPNDIADIVTAFNQLVKQGEDSETEEKSSSSHKRSATRDSKNRSRSSPRSNKAIKSSTRAGGGRGDRGGVRTGGTKDKDVNDAGNDEDGETSAKLTGFQLACNRAVVSSRNQAYNSYLVSFHERIMSTQSMILTMEAKQQRFKENWETMLTYLASPPAEAIQEEVGSDDTI